MFKNEVGRWGEDLACKYLIDMGYVILERNYHTRYGEIDIIAQLHDQLIFVEVKTRTSKHFGYPEEAYTYSKNDHLVNSILIFLECHPEIIDNWQIDLISIEGKYLASSPLITHFQNLVME